MTGRALLLGCPDPNLIGVEADLAMMTRLLLRRGFTDLVTLMRGERAAILAALAALVERTTNGDAVVVYYTGHGWRADMPPGRSGPRDFQGIAPADLQATTAADFRGILADELSEVLDDLTEKTANVTAIFDCCHATGVMRRRGEAASAGVRALPVPWTIPADELFHELRTRGLARARRDPETNPLAVRLYACRPHETAGEDLEVPGGLLTRALERALAEPGEHVWADIVRRVAALVVAIRPDQHPVVVGPARRLVFSLDTRAGDGACECFTRGGALWVSGGALTDVRVGDRFLAAATRTRLEVVEVAVDRARVLGDASPDDGATAVPVGWASPRAVVVVPADLPRRALVVAALAAAGSLACAPCEELPIVGSLAVGDAGRLEIRDPDGTPVPIDEPRDPAHDDTLDRTCARLVAMARAASLRRLTSAAPLAPDTYPFTLEWALAAPRRPLTAGSAVPRGACITACVCNTGARTLYVILFAADAAGGVTLLTRSQPTGVELAEGGVYVLGEDRWHGCVGVPLPDASPYPRRVGLVALVLSAGVSLGAWETSVAGTRRPAPATSSRESAITYSVTTLEVIVVV